MKFIKNSGSSYANEESFEVYDGSTLLYTSPTFANNEERTIEECLTSSTNNQYTLRLIDSYGDCWYSKSYLRVYGQYGNAVFKNFMTASDEETYQISLYYGIYENDQWKMATGSVTGSWTEYNFAEGSGWSQETLGYVSGSVSGTQYFRKQFTGLANMAAYDVRLYYKAGVVAYINGAEVYRDNMDPGTVTSDTPASGQHSTIAYRGFIRPGAEVNSTQSILAVELHFTQEQPQTYVDFNAYLAILAPSALDTTCFIYAEPITITATSGTNPTNILDFSKTTYVYLYSSTLPSTVTYTLSGPRPYFNAVRVWPYTSPSNAPSTFTFEGSNDGQDWTNVVDIEGARYENSVYQTFYGYFHSSLFSNYRAYIVSSSSSYVYAYEMQPLICSNVLPTTVAFSPNTYTYYAYYEEVYIRPEVTEFTSCTAQNLPEGLSIDSTTCVITGYGANVASGVVVTVSSVVQGTTYTGTFTITFEDCPHTFISVLRTYKTTAYYESFDIKDASTQEVVLSVAYNSGQVNNEDWVGIACVSGSKYVVTTDSSINYWIGGSHLYVRSILSGDEMETILRVRYDLNIGFPTSRTFNINYSIGTHSNWYYKHGEVPADWYSSTSTEGWTQGNDSNFPASANQIQLYKSTFNVDDINNIAGVVLSIKYKYGIVVYLNGNEAFRNGVSDATISASSYASNIYSDVIYRQVSLPIKTVQIGDVASVNLIQQGSNTIAIGLVAANAAQTEANFDCAVRLMAESSASRIFDYTVTYNKISGSPSSILNQYYSSSMYYSTCNTNYFNIAFENDRREWIDALTVKLHYTQDTQQPREFVLKARNSGEDWTTLSTVTNLTWSQAAQAHTIYFQNNKAYNEYRFENFATGDSSACYWKIGTLDLKSVMTTMTIPELSYNVEPVFKDIEMAEMYPNSEYYYGFQITPALPDGISLDPNTGMISGTATAETAAQQYTITANKLTGGTSSTTFTLDVGICTGGRSLVTLVARTDSNPFQASYKLYEGIGTSGTVVDSIDAYRVPSALNYADFCKEDGIYTLELLDSSSNGWTNPAGYYLTVDVGEMIFEMGQLPLSTSSVTTMFSTYFPFQINYSDWKVNKNGYVDNWNRVDFDDSAWSSVKANAIGASTSITTYIRHDVNIPDINNYYVLNVRVKYAGGVAAYFNGRLVARFNLGEDFDSETRSITIHDQDAFSKFHVIMTTVGGVTGKNVMAFEIHLPSGQSSASSVVFDATGIFGVNECSIGVDTFSQIDGSSPTSCTLEELLDLNPTTYGNQPNSLGSYLEWTVENLVGTKFNSFAMQTAYTRSSYGFSLYVRSNETDEYTSALAVLGQSTKAMSRCAWSVPLGIAGFKQLRFEVDDTASSTVTVSSYILQYCKPSGSDLCPGIGDYPSVGEGKISPAPCGEGYRGYSYRVCSGGVLGDIITTNCTQKIPGKLLYDASIYNLVMDTNVHIAAPSYQNVIEEFYLAENTFLPIGLALNRQTGEITGIPTQESVLNTYTIYGKNQVGVTFTSIAIFIRRGRCRSVDNFPSTDVGQVAVYDCALGGSYIGTLKKACLLGEEDGEWQGTTGFCMSISLIVILVVVVIIVIIIVIFFIVRVNRKAKAVGGVKGKASNKKSISKASNKNSVKV